MSEQYLFTYYDAIMSLLTRTSKFKATASVDGSSPVKRNNASVKS
jgi:hypothetical protein